jgi:hypothetical protein
MSVDPSSVGVTTSKLAADRATGVAVLAPAAAEAAGGAGSGCASGPYSARQSS